MRKNSLVWWKQFTTAENAFLELCLEGFQYDFKNQAERLKGWKFNFDKFQSTMTENEKSKFEDWMTEIKKRGTKI